jgi:hypothetical protein
LITSVLENEAMIDGRGGLAGLERQRLLSMSDASGGHGQQEPQESPQS